MKIFICVVMSGGLLLLSSVVRFADAANGDCGQPRSTGSLPTATDALFALRTAVGLESCALRICDVDGSCTVSAADALRLLKVSVGTALALDCAGPCGSTTTTQPSTTTSTSTTSTTATTTLVSSSTTTLPSPTTTLTSTTTTTIARPATWSNVLPIFQASGCDNQACHGRSPGSGKLGLISDFEAGYNELLNETVQCSGSAFVNRVTPGAPAESFLVAKLEGTQDCGNQMPLSSSDRVSPSDINLIRAWILDGAPQN